MPKQPKRGQYDAASRPSGIEVRITYPRPFDSTDKRIVKMVADAVAFSLGALESAKVADREDVAAFIAHVAWPLTRNLLRCNEDGAVAILIKPPGGGGDPQFSVRTNGNGNGHSRSQPL